MEASSLSILVDEKRVNDILKQKTGLKAFILSIANVCFFVFFLLLYTGLALSEPLKVHRAFEGYIRRRFDENAAMPLHEVTSIRSFWSYTNRTILPAIYGNDTAFYFFPGRTTPVFHPIDEQNRIFGSGARLRMVKIQPNQECEIRPAYADYFPTCYGAYQPDFVVTDPFGPVDETGAPIFMYTKALAGEVPYVGKVATYEPGGYSQLLSADLNHTLNQLNHMIVYDWIDQSARALFYEFTIYNFNLGAYAVCTISFEVSPSGTWVKTFNVDVLQQRHLNPLGLGTDWEWFLLICEVCLILCVIRFALEEASEFLGVKKEPDNPLPLRYRPVIKFDYFADTWNLLDWVNLILMIVVMQYRIETWMAAANVTVTKVDYAALPNTFSDLGAVAEKVRMMRSLTAFNSVLTWFKAVKYITAIPYITLFMQTVTEAQEFLIGFVILFSTSMIGFMLAYNSAFGERLAQFRDPIKAGMFLIRAFFGDSRMEIVYEAANFVGSSLILLFALCMMFVVTQLFQAIIISSWSDALAKEHGKGNKEWKKTLEKVEEFWEAINHFGRLEQRFRSFVPGLYSRLMIRKRKKEEMEKARDEAQEARERAARALEQQGVGTAVSAVALGRRPRRKKESLDDDASSSEDDSEADLGEIRNQDQLDDDSEEEANFAATMDGFGTATSTTSKKEPEFSAEARDKVFKATRHVVASIVDHTRGAKAVLSADMDESKEVLMGLSNVLEVLRQRAQSLETQQIELLRQY